MAADRRRCPSFSLSMTTSVGAYGTGNWNVVASKFPDKCCLVTRIRHGKHVPCGYAKSVSQIWKIRVPYLIHRDETPPLPEGAWAPPFIRASVDELADKIPDCGKAGAWTLVRCCRIIMMTGVMTHDTSSHWDRRGDRKAQWHVPSLGCSSVYMVFKFWWKCALMITYSNEN